MKWLIAIFVMFCASAGWSAQPSAPASIAVLKDFGSGYVYKVLIEEAKLQK